MELPASAVRSSEKLRRGRSNSSKSLAKLGFGKIYDRDTLSGRVGIEMSAFLEYRVGVAVACRASSLKKFLRERYSSAAAVHRRRFTFAKIYFAPFPPLEVGKRQTCTKYIFKLFLTSSIRYYIPQDGQQTSNATRSRLDKCLDALYSKRPADGRLPLASPPYQLTLPAMSPPKSLPLHGH